MGYCHLRQAVRIFAVERIRDCEVLTAHFEIPEKFDVDTYLEGAWGIVRGDIVTVKVLFARPLARYIRDRLWHPTQRFRGLVASRPRFKPAAVSEEVDQARDETDTLAPASRKAREGRFGATFGTTVHRAIGLVLRDPGLSTAEALGRASRSTGLVEHLPDAAEDVDRALARLRAEGFCRPAGPHLQIEYPIAGTAQDGRLLSGYIDLVSVTATQLDVIDFKTDAPPAGPVAEAYGSYVSQVRTYGRLLIHAGAAEGRRVRTGLLFTADGDIHWV